MTHLFSLSNLKVTVFILFVLLPLIGASSTQANSLENRSIAFYALSRGTGVPEATMKALNKVRTRFTELHDQGEVSRVIENRIGIEGETRICAEFITESVVQREWANLKEMVKELDLANIKKELCD